MTQPSVFYSGIYEHGLYLLAYHVSNNFGFDVALVIIALGQIGTRQQADNTVRALEIAVTGRCLLQMRRGEG